MTRRYDLSGKSCAFFSPPAEKKKKKNRKDPLQGNFYKGTLEMKNISPYLFLNESLGMR